MIIIFGMPKQEIKVCSARCVSSAFTVAYNDIENQYFVKESIATKSVYTPLLWAMDNRCAWCE